MPDTSHKKDSPLTSAEIRKAWWRATRPAFYIATIIPLTLGYIVAGKDFGIWRPWLFCVVILISFFLHLSANLANDLFDYLLGTDTTDTIGGSGAIQSGAITIPTYKKTLVFLFAGALALGALGSLYTGYKGIWLITVFASLSSFYYVAPPIRYGYRAMGEVFVFLNMGVTMTAGCTYSLTGVISPHAIALSVPVGLMVAGILYFQSLPEIETDLAAGKHTLANTLGPERAVTLFRFWWPCIWLLMLFLWLLELCSWPIFIGILASIPFYKKARSKVEFSLDTHEWLPLDQYGHLIRKMYLICGLSIVAGLLV